MVIMSDLLVVPTIQYQNEYSESDLRDEAYDIDYNWEAYIDDGDYPLGVSTSWDHEVDLSDDNPSNVKEAREASANYLKDNYSYLIDDYDAFAVYDERSDAMDANGNAEIGSTSDQAAGSDVFEECTAYVTRHGVVGQHEIGHLYAGRHKRCRMYLDQDYHTVMASYSNTEEDCPGRDFEWQSSTTREFYHCVINDVQDYYDYWDL